MTFSIILYNKKISDYFIDSHEYYLTISIKIKMWKNNDTKNGRTGYSGHERRREKLGINVRTFVTLQYHTFPLEYFHGCFRCWQGTTPRTISAAHKVNVLVFGHVPVFARMSTLWVIFTFSSILIVLKL